MILASDYDITLTQVDGTVLTSDKQAIAQFRQMGHNFGICSGRSVANIYEKCCKNNIEVDFMIGNNGAVVKVENQLLTNQSFTYLENEQLFDFISKRCLSFALCDGNNYALAGIGKVLLKRYLTPRNVTLKMMKKSNHVVSYVIYMIKPQYKKTFVQEIESQFNVSCYYNTFSLDVMVKVVNKAAGCKVIENYYNEPLYCIGDGENDLPMIESYHGFCVNRGSAHVKEVASQCFDNVSDAINYLTINNTVL